MSKTPTKIPRSTKQEKVGPKEAEAYLKTMVKNRTPSKYHVAMLASMMLAGQWKDNSEPIIFDWDGHLMDGQHRLLAVIESGATIILTVNRGLDPTIFPSLNNARVRSGGDVLKMNGYSNGPVMAAAIKLVILYDTSDMTNQRNSKLSNVQLDEVIDQYPKMADSVLKGRRCKQVLPGSVASALHYICARVCRDTADLFFENLASGSMLKEDDPIFKLRNWGVNHMKKKGHMLSRPETFKAVILAWNMVRQGKTCKKFIVDYSPEEKLPKLQ